MAKPEPLVTIQSEDCGSVDMICSILPTQAYHDTDIHRYNISVYQQSKPRSLRNSLHGVVRVESVPRVYIFTHAVTRYRLPFPLILFWLAFSTKYSTLLVIWFD